MIETITLGEVAVFVAFIVALMKGADYLIDTYKKPTNDLDAKLSKRLDKIEADNKMMLKVLYSLLQHEVTGDHANDMESLYKEISNYIIDK